MPRWPKKAVPQTKKGPSHCELCDLWFVDANHYKRHQNTPHTKCALCNKGYVATGHAPREHQAQCTKLKMQERCSLCKVGFAKPPHRRVHEALPHAKCPDCEEWMLASRLRRHRLQHQDRPQNEHKHQPRFQYQYRPLNQPRYQHQKKQQKKHQNQDQKPQPGSVNLMPRLLHQDQRQNRRQKKHRDHRQEAQPGSFTPVNIMPRPQHQDQPQIQPHIQHQQKHQNQDQKPQPGGFTAVDLMPHSLAHFAATPIPFDVDAYYNFAVGVPQSLTSLRGSMPAFFDDKS